MICVNSHARRSAGDSSNVALVLLNRASVTKLKPPLHTRLMNESSMAASHSTDQQSDVSVEDCCEVAIELCVAAHDALGHREVRFQLHCVHTTLSAATSQEHMVSLAKACAVQFTCKADHMIGPYTSRIEYAVPWSHL
jgi:hypothetical protein